MPLWSMRVRATKTNVHSVANTKHEAADELVRDLSKVLPGWTVTVDTAVRVYSEHDLVTAAREDASLPKVGGRSGVRNEYARVVKASTGELRVRFADGTERPISAAVDGG